MYCKKRIGYEFYVTVDRRIDLKHSFTQSSSPFVLRTAERVETLVLLSLNFLASVGSCSSSRVLVIQRFELQ